MNLKFKLILVRHADYDGNGADPEISSYGITQAKRLAKSIKEEIGSEDVTIWTSSAKRASQTAQSVKSELQLVQEFKEFEKLWSDNRHQYDFPWFQSQLENFKGTGVLIVFSHLEYVREFG